MSYASYNAVLQAGIDALDHPKRKLEKVEQSRRRRVIRRLKIMVHDILSDADVNSLKHFRSVEARRQKLHRDKKAKV